MTIRKNIMMLVAACCWSGPVMMVVALLQIISSFLLHQTKSSHHIVLQIIGEEKITAEKSLSLEYAYIFRRMKGDHDGNRHQCNLIATIQNKWDNRSSK